MGKQSGKLGAFIAGAVVGAGIGILFAPQEGSKTRKQLKAKMDELIENIKEIDVHEVKDQIEAKIAEIKAGLKDLDAETVLSAAKQKGHELAKKADELVKLAVKKGTPVVQGIASDVRQKTIHVLEGTLEKLEKQEAEAKTAKKKTTKKA